MGLALKLSTQLSVSGDELAFGRHTFTMVRYVDSSGKEATVVQSFEKAAGPQLNDKQNALAWTAALQESMLDG